ncbi:hypothetical protein [Lusitaniella coriacea]|uniref:hypothetical protein n=1 Tax=Lusitaniella coriacea TaxID=1983105 RepID=UPI003CF360E7
MKYKIFENPEWKTVKFSEDEYFDLDPGEKAEWDSVRWHNDLRDYLDLEKISIQYVEAVVIDSISGISKSLHSTFWNEGENEIVEVVVSGKTSYHETIISVKIQEAPIVFEILRFHYENNLPVLSYHGFIKRNEDGSEEERIVYTISKERER